jgi:hypothetical protein
LGRPEASAAEQAVGSGQSKDQQHRIHTTAAKQLLDNNSIANSPLSSLRRRQPPPQQQRPSSMLSKILRRLALPSQ